MAKTRIVLFHKPYGYLSQFTDADNRPGLKRFGLPAGIYAAGRLDHDSEGLLLFTDDGGLNRRLTDPRFNHPRSYWVQVEGAPTEEALSKLRKGLVLNDGKTKPCKAKLLSEAPSLPPREVPRKETSWLELTLTEGRNRQVRRMTAAVGHPTLRLVRCAIGALQIAGLEPGKWRWVDRRELTQKPE